MIAARRSFGIVTYVVLVVLVIAVLLPLAWLYLSSIKNGVEMYSIPPIIIPRNPTLSSYRQIFTDRGFESGFLNSVIVAVVSTLATIVLSCPAAYGFSRYLNRGGSVIMFFVLATRMFPPVTFCLPFFMLMLHLHLINTKVGLAIVYLSFQLPLAIWLLESFFREIPRELEDAGKVDGLSRTQILIRLVIPLALPGLAVATIFSFLLSWNEFIYALILTRTDVARTVPVVISGWISVFQILWGKMTAASGVYVLPALVFVSFVQKGMLKGLMQGGLKG